MNLLDLINHLKPSVLRAGERIMDIYKTSINEELKSDGSPVTEADKDAEEINRWNLLNPNKKNKKSYLDECLIDENGPVIACSDYVKLVAEQISPYVNCGFTAIGTDGFGRSGTRDELRNFFEIDRFYITLAAINSLHRQGKVKSEKVNEVISKYKIDSDRVNPLKR